MAALSPVTGARWGRKGSFDFDPTFFLNTSHNTTQPTTAQTAATTPKYTSFYDALLKRKDLTIVKAAIDSLGLKPYLSKPDFPITILVPTDAAFMALAKKYNIGVTALGGPGAQTQLKQVLYYHFLKGAFPTGKLAKGQVLATMLAGKSVTVTAKGAVNNAAKGGYLPTFSSPGGVATVTQANIKCGTGLAHIINNVLTPIALTPSLFAMG